MPDTLKTAITLPGKLETLTTANGSPMHIIGHAIITLHLKNLRVTHHFIVVESLMTDVILGIDFQRECKAQPHRTLLSYPFCNTAAHMEATPTREGI